jgi:hypothetical protein
MFLNIIYFNKQLVFNILLTKKYKNKINLQNHTKTYQFNKLHISIFIKLK